MDFKTGLLVISLLVGCIALPAPEDDMSRFFDHTDASARIVGGTQAAVGSHPHMVAMSSGVLVRSFLCGGSLITSRTVLTAAHCIAAVFSGGSLVNSLRVTVGTNRWNSGGVAYTLARNVTHPNYVSATIKNDIGILITSNNVALNNLVRTVPLTYAHIPGGVNARVAGWGRIRAGGALSATLLELFPTTIDGNDCVARVARASVELNVRAPPVEPHIEVCTFHAPGFGTCNAGGALSATLLELFPTTIDGNDCVARVARASVELNVRAPPVEPHIEVCTFHAPGFGTCNGDSGSALTRADNGQQFGIVSWGFPCARGAPDMFVRVSAYQSWLQANVV